MHQIAVFLVPGTLVLLQFPAGAELFADAEYTGENALRRDLQIGGEESAPVEIRQAAALGVQDVIDRGNHEVEVLRPRDEAGMWLLLIPATAWISEADKRGYRCLGIRWALYVEHPDEGFRFIRVGEVRVIEHDEDLEDDTVIGADLIRPAVDFNRCWQRKHKKILLMVRKDH